MSAQTETVERGSQATPLARDVLSILRQQLRGGGGGGRGGGEQPQVRHTQFGPIPMDGGGETPQQRGGRLDANAFGTGVGPLQRQAGTAMQQLVRSLQGGQGGQSVPEVPQAQTEATEAARRFIGQTRGQGDLPEVPQAQRQATEALGGLVERLQGGGTGLPAEQRQALEQIQANQREQALADLGEQFGMAGASLGTPQSVGQARLLSELVPRQTQQLFTEGRARNQQLMRSAQGLGQLGGQQFGQELARVQEGRAQRGQHLRGIAQLSRLGQQRFGQGLAQLQEGRAQTDQLMQAIMGMQQLGQQNIVPFLQMASQGIIPEEVVVKEHPLVSAAGAVAGLTQGAGKAAKGFGIAGAG